MAEALSLWRDRLGYLHPCEASAEASDQWLSELTEREQRRAIVRRLLIAQINGHQGRRLLRADVCGQEAADWIIANWSALAAIGLSFRIHDLEAAAPADRATAIEAASPVLHVAAVAEARSMEPVA